MTDQQVTTKDAIGELISRFKDYPSDAYEFVLEGLNYTVNLLDKPRHISGKELLEGIKNYALHQFGPMALTVLKNWKIHSCQDFGKIVFRLVDASILRKTDQDSMDDFLDGYHFEDVFKNQI